MAQNSSRDRLNHLLELAAEGPAGRAALLGDLADLLLDWPQDYAQAMRAPFEALLEKTAREADAAARAALAERIAADGALPTDLLNEIFFDASREARARILKRNAALDGEAAPLGVDSHALVAAARRALNGGFARIFAEALSLPRATAERILADPECLAIACKGAGLDRAAYSAIALLSAGALADFEAIPEAGARRLSQFWQTRTQGP